jgi:hypothetical protein
VRHPCKSMSATDWHLIEIKDQSAMSVPDAVEIHP